MIHIAKSRIVRRSAILVVIGLSLLIPFYAIVTSSYEPHGWQIPEVNVLRLSQMLVGISASVFLPSPFSNGLSTAVNRSSGSPVLSRCPGLPDSDEDGDRQACQQVLRGEVGSKPRRTVMEPAEYLERTQKCDCFRFDLGYFVSPEDTTDEERQFPIAFSLLIYESLEQTERLLRLIYRPHNVFCIHVDAKSPAELHNGLQAIANCFDNVFIAKPPINVNWGKVSIVHAELLCMRQLLKYKRWKYFINLVGRDFPLRTNLELVKILTAYNGSNDVDGTRNGEKHYFPDWFQFSWISHEERGEPKEPVPHSFDVAKGSTHMAVTREFVEFAVNDPRANDLLFWMRNIKVPDEHFFPTLNHNPMMGIPGAFKDGEQDATILSSIGAPEVVWRVVRHALIILKLAKFYNDVDSCRLGDPDAKKSFVRAKHWSFAVGDNSKCYGQFIRWVCNVGVRDLPWVTASPHMFLNKIRIEKDPIAFRCLELWYRDRVRRQRNGNYTFDVSIYASQPFVRDHV